MELKDIKNRVVIMESWTHPKLARKICNLLQIEWNPVQVKRFGEGGCTLAKFKNSVRGKIVLILETQKQPVNDNYIILQQILRSVASDAEEVFILMPSYIYERSDQKDQEHSCEFASTVYNTLKRLGMRGMWTNDLHNQSIVSNEDGGVFINHLSAMNLYVKYIKDNLKLNDYTLGVCDSDSKLVENFASRLDYNGDLIIFPSTRKGNDNKKHHGDPVGNIKPGQDVVLIDDQSLTAGTVISAAEKLKEIYDIGNIYVFVTKIWPSHDYNSKFVAKIENSCITKFITTDSVAFEKSILTDKFEVLSIAEMYAEAIKSWLLYKPFPKKYKFSLK